MILFKNLTLQPLEDRTTPTAGTLDTSFDGDGIAVVPSVGDYYGQWADATAVQSDGKILLASGPTHSNNLNSFTITRLTAAGVPDSTFGTAGRVNVPFSDGFTFHDVRPSAIAVRPNGKIIVVGFALPAPSSFIPDFAVVQLNANGTLDTQFGTGGKLTFGFEATSANEDERATAVALQPDGKVVVVGTVSRNNVTGSRYDVFGVARLTEAGGFDPTFGVGGKLTFGFDLASPAGATDDSARSVAIRPDGKIVVGGHAKTHTGGFDFAVAQLTPAGVLDPTFGTGGKATLAFDLGGDKYDTLDTLLLQPDGRIVLAGSAQLTSTGTGSNYDFVVARLTESGAPDPTFGGAGRATIPFDLGGSGYDTIYSAALQPDGKILLSGGVITTAMGEDIAVVRLTSAGALDPSFGTGGKSTFGLNLGGFNNDAGLGVVVQPDGRIVVGGGTSLTSGALGAAVIRLLGDPPPPPPPNTPPTLSNVADMAIGVNGNTGPIGPTTTSSIRTSPCRWNWRGWPIRSSGRRRN